jgi:hypothetical protein
VWMFVASKKIREPESLKTAFAGRILIRTAFAPHTFRSSVASHSARTMRRAMRVHCHLHM